MKAGTIFMLSNLDLRDSGINDSGLGYATFIRVEWGESGRSFWSGFSTTVILYNGSGLVVESILERCRGKRGIHVHEML